MPVIDSPFPMFAAVISANAVYLVAILGAGLIFEATCSSRPVPARSARLNLGIGALYWMVYVTVNAAFTVLVIRGVSRLPHAPLLTLPTPRTFGGVVGFAVLLLGVRDFCYYWMHRAQHAIPVLWAQHALHHADEAMNVTTAWRHHWTDPFLQTVCVLAPTLYLCTVDVRVGVLLGLMGDLGVLFVHANTPLRIGRLAYIVMSPAWHRVHHSSERRHFDRNFASAFSLWDVLFRTHYVPQPDEAPPTGLHHGEQAESVWSAAVFPWRMWRAIQRRARRQFIT